MSVKGEKYKSMAAKKRHETSEGSKERKMEYGKKPVKKAVAKKAATNKVALVMGEFKRGTLHAGVDPKGPKKAAVVKSRSQAIAIALAKARKKK